MRGIWIKMKETNLTVRHEIGYIMVVQLKLKAGGGHDFYNTNINTNIRHLGMRYKLTVFV
jgi:hypothetical protein